MKAIFVIGDKLLDISQILSMTINESELALILEYQTSDNIVVAYCRSIVEFNDNRALIEQEISSREDPDEPSPEPTPIPTKPDSKITLSILQEILKAYATKVDVVFRNGATLPKTCDFDNLLIEEDLHIVFPSMPSTNYLHAPTGWTSGIVLVGNIGGYSYNIAYATNNNCYFRTHDPDRGWNPWFKIASLESITTEVRSLIREAIEPILSLIPAQANPQNQLADKAFVNSSIQTSTANFRGSWSSWSVVPTDPSLYLTDYVGSTIPTLNDYLVVQDSSDFPSSSLEGTWRFKYIGSWEVLGKSGWQPEYQVNETPLTAAQIAALNSGITAEIVSRIGEGNVKTVNHIEPDDDKNVQTDIEILSEDYSEIEPDPNITYFVPDGLSPDLKIINDEATELETTWSSEKIQGKITEINNDISDVEGKIPTWIYAGSQVIWSGPSTFSANVKTALIGAYDRGILLNAQIDPAPTGYVLRCYLTMQGTTNSGIQVRAILNSYVATSWCSTYSTTTFRTLVKSGSFDPYAVTYEPTLGYTSRNGINLYVQTTNVTGQAVVYNITVHYVYVKQ